MTNERRQAHTARKTVCLPISRNLLDVDWRGERVDSDVGGIDDAHLIAVLKPDSPIGRLRNVRPVGTQDANQLNAIGTVEYGWLNLPLRVGGPGV